MIESLDVNVDDSLEPAELLALDEEQKTRLASILDQVLSGLEQGEAHDVQQLELEHPDLADVLVLYLEKLSALVPMPTGAKQENAPLIDVEFNQQLGDFRLLHEIGRGGMGVVYEARQASLNRTVAIKLLPLASMLDAHQIARFQNEAHAAGLLNHANIVPVYCVGVERGIHFYAMQLINGLSMEAWIEEQRSYRHEQWNPSGCVAWQTIVSWAAQISEALHAAHEAGVVHRDVKPSNLMLDEAGKVWITDFGLARVQSDVSLTGSGDLLGTMRYMSPEQACGEAALVDGRCDIYSLAATIYEMLALRPVHEGSDAATLLKKIDAHQLTPLRQICRELPRDLETVLHKALSKSRDQRYETARDFAADLRRVLAEEPTVARPPTPLDRIVRWGSKHRRSVLASLLIAALAVIGLGVGTAMLAAEKSISDANARRSDRNLRLARGVVDELGTQIAEMLDEIPAAERVRAQLLQQTLMYHQRFAAEIERDPEYSQDLAITYGKIGALHSQLGANDESLEALRLSERLYEQLAHRETDDAIQLAWSIAQNNLAKAQHASGNLQDAARYFSSAVALQEQLLASSTNSSVSPADDSQTRDGTASLILQLTTSLNNLGLLLAESGAFDRAQEIYQRAVELLIESDEVDHEGALSGQLATVRTNLSAALLPQDPSRAIREAQEALRGQLQALEAAPGNARLAQQTIATLNTLGSAQAAYRQYTAAVASYQQSVDIAQQLLQRLPEYPPYRRDLVLSLNHLGLAYSRVGDLPEARQAFEEARAQQQSLCEAFPTNAEWFSMLGAVFNNLGFLHRQLESSDVAAECFRSAIAAQEKAIKLAPDVQRYRDYLKKHTANLDPLPTGGNAT
ncbi:serine/threonine-protein kinase [Aureliella helgolandensis]|uniref:Serine/threonine-protein kinase PrkC n=1 Tax=Aureliella helgolandensis TaxID=2527968 RepID=A0A518G403_9BACT|nr:serine/threonine-protein kinase [Aureliella helgolandensis]QDV23333.1 Serine/threonine-protein kinase PrkC [Aureliella helgolandensis]